MDLNPFRILRRRARLNKAAAEEAEFLRRRFGEQAHEAALQEAERTDLTSWGREVMRAAADQLRPREPKAEGEAG